MATKARYEKKDGIGYITFYEEMETRPCTMDWDSLEMLEQAIRKIREDGEIRAAVLSSSSPKSFVVGANIKVLETLNHENIGGWVRNGHRIYNQLQALPVPVIARVEGYCLGGGLELAMACDMIVASEEARFAQPEASLGVMPGWGGSCRLANLVGISRAKEMFFTGKQIDAKQAYEWGLVNHVFAKDKMDEGMDEILDSIRKNDARVLGLVKEIVNIHNQQEILQNACEEANASSLCMASPSTQGRLERFFLSRKK